MKRVISLWFPTFATDRLSRFLITKQRTGKPQDKPLATVTAVHGGQRIMAANGAAQGEGVQPGMTLANARALYPGLTVHQADPDADFKALSGIAQACGRYSPWTSIDSFRRDGVWLDITGCAHLFGSEDALLADLRARLENIGYQMRAGLADTPGAAWALARFGDQCDIAAPRTEKERLAPLPMAALRLTGETVEGLERMGLRRIGQLYDMPRAPLARRFGGDALRRLDQGSLS